MGVLRLSSLLAPGKRGRAAAHARDPRRQPAPAVRRRRPLAGDGGAGDAESSGAPRRALARAAGHGMAPGEEAVPEAEAAEGEAEAKLDGEAEAKHDGVMSEASEEERVMTVLQFYEEKVQELTSAQGDRDHLPISGNIYMYRAIAKFGQCKMEDNNSLFQQHAGPYVWSGIILIMAIQILAPFVLLIWAIRNVNTIDGSVIGVQAWRINLDESNDISYLFSRILAVMFLLLFTINGTYALKSDMVETEKMVCLCRVFNKVADKRPFDPETGRGFQHCDERWLWVGAIVNSLLIINLSLCMLFVFIIAGGEAGPKDIIFDAFGITFLYNLDDPSGDLSFLDELWDEGVIGDIYGKLADQKKIMADITRERETTFTSNNIYQAALYIMQALIVLLPVSFIFFQLKFVDMEMEP